MAKNEYDVVIWGATGFTGRLVVEYLVANYGVGGDLSWALAGRNPQRLEEVRDEFLTPNERKKLPVLLADSEDETRVAALVSQSRVLCSTVGPYAKYGTPLVAAGAEAGVD